jgi:Ca2+-binding RTX toxin-like protein
MLLLLVPVQAQAGVAGMTSDALVYNAYAGEVNDVTVTVEDSRNLLVTDATGQVNVEERCVKLSDHQARCSARPRRELLRFRHQVYLQDGNDKARGPVNMRGGDGDDELVDETEYTLWANTGYGFVGAMGDAGNDTIVGAGHGNEGNDVLRALPGQTAELYGGVGDDRLEGGSADDFFAPGPGSDHVVSGGGRDWLSFDDDPFDPVRPQAPVTFSLENGAQGGRAGEGDTYEGIFVEIRVGPSPGSVVTGNELNNRITGLGTLRGLGGDDELVSGSNRLVGNLESDDRLEGGDGDDRLDGGHGPDVDAFDGGAGDDRIQAADEGDIEGDSPGRSVEPRRDEISCGPGQDRIDVDSADPRPADCEIVALLFDRGSTITGSPADDVIPGFNTHGTRDRILGGDGDDQIEGGFGADALFGQDGNDRLIGEHASAERSPGVDPANGDTLSGGAGNDHVIGGFGADRITGGAGLDRISGGDANDTIGARDGRRDKVRCGAGRDSVTADRRDSVSRDCERVRRR